jgi:hypothetical protein
MTNSDVKAGFTGGMLLTLLSTIGSSDIIKTAVLSAIGAGVSFMITMVFRQVFKK